MNQEARNWAMALHFSMLAGTVLPLAGFIAPIVIWQVKKSYLPEIDEHGKAAVNWMISSLIYAVIGFVLCFVLIGYVILPVLAALGVIFPIIAGVKASNGEHWTYPLSFRFFI